MKKIYLSGVAAGLLMIGGSTVLNAGFGDALVGGVVGGVVGSVITNEVYHGHRRHYHGHRRHRSIRPVMTDEKRIQIALQSLGLYHGVIDGQINSYETRNAIRELNRQYGISEGAYLSPQERDALVYLGTLLDFDRKLNAPGGDRRTRTRRIQTALKVLGFYSGKLDGSNGPMTRRAIANYREANGLPPGTRLGYEDEYRLISTAKQANDRNIRETMNSLKRMGAANGGLQRGQAAQPVILRQPAPMPSPAQHRMPPVAQPVPLQPEAAQGAPMTPPPPAMTAPRQAPVPAMSAPQPVSPAPASTPVPPMPSTMSQSAPTVSQPSQKAMPPQPVQPTPAP